MLPTGPEILYLDLAKPGMFDVGQLLTTLGASDVLLAALHVPAEFLLQDKHSEWDDICAEGRGENERP